MRPGRPYTLFLSWRLVLLPLLAAVIAAGAIVTWSAARQADRDMRAQLLMEAGMVERAIDLRHLQRLSGSPADLASPDYQRLKDQLTRVRSANPACRFLYLMGQRPDGTVFFFVDSEQEGTPDSSPPDNSTPRFRRTTCASSPRGGRLPSAPSLTGGAIG
jgi:hypothetical protein